MESAVNYKSPVIQSLCWDCRHTLKCDWILNKKQVWKEAIKKRKYYSGENREVVSYVVVVCDYFEVEARRNEA